MDAQFPVMNLSLWKADAVVLHHWLSTVDLDALPFEDESQRQALLDLLTELDQTDVADADDAEIVAAHTQVTRAPAAAAAGASAAAAADQT